MEKEQDKKPVSLKRELLSWAKVLLAGVVLALLITNFVVVNATVISGSMHNTIMTDARVMGLRLTYLFHDPERFDIIACYVSEKSEKEEIYVKRVIGLPGETVEIVDGKVYIDGASQPLPDYFTPEPPEDDYGPFVVPEGHYFLMGDNRNGSFDSKDWSQPYLPRKKVIGKIYFTYFPRLEWLATPVEQADGD